MVSKTELGGSPMEPGMADFLAAQYLREHLRDTKQKRPAHPVRRHGRPVRTRVAEWLRALAARIDEPAHLESASATA
jgi:hypothetical protein